jgi:predicted MFS family arabinose efflux permease
MLGVIWCVVFAWRFRNRPDEQPQTNLAERELIASGRERTGGAHRVPWTAILFNWNLLCLYVMYFCITYGWYFHMTYLPACLENRYGVEKTSVLGAIMKGGPLWLGAVGCLVGGYLADGLLRRGMRLRWARRLPGLIGLTLCAICYMVAAGMPTAWSFAVAISLAAFFNDLTIGGTWAMCQDVGGRHTAVVAGFLNTSASAGAAVAGWCSGMVLNYYIARRPATEHVAALVDGYQTNLLIYAAVTVVAAISWLGADAERQVPQN